MASKKANLANVTQRFKILGDPNRLRIVMALLEVKSVNVSHLCRQLRMSQPTVSRHLGILKMMKMAQANRLGKEIFYSITAVQKRSIKSMIQQAGKLGQ